MSDEPDAILTPDGEGGVTIVEDEELNRYLLYGLGALALLVVAKVIL